MMFVKFYLPMAIFVAFDMSTHSLVSKKCSVHPLTP